jgi:hypothetical protein
MTISPWSLMVAALKAAERPAYSSVSRARDRRRRRSRPHPVRRRCLRHRRPRPLVRPLPNRRRCSCWPRGTGAMSGISLTLVGRPTRGPAACAIVGGWNPRHPCPAWALAQRPLRVLRGRAGVLSFHRRGLPAGRTRRGGWPRRPPGADASGTDEPAGSPRDARRRTGAPRAHDRARDRDQPTLVRTWEVVAAGLAPARPPSTWLGVSALGYLGQLVEIDGVAALPR